MRLYWTINSIPELRSLPKRERKQVWRRCYNKILRHWQTWVALALCGICSGAGGALGRLAFVDSYLILVCIAAGGGIGGFIFSQVAIHVAIPYIREEISSRGHEIAY